MTHPFPGSRFDDGFFAVDRHHGFLPRVTPLARLPEPFGPVQDLLDAMPVHLGDPGPLGQDDPPPQAPGLLATPDAIVAPVLALPDLHDAVAALDVADPDQHRLIAALFRSYAFLASAFLLEPAHQAHVASGGRGTYGRARSVLPAQLARPLVAAADKLGVHPWLDYHYAYSLGNYTFRDPTLPAEQRFRWENLTMANRFSGTPDEIGFIMLHVHIDSHSAALIAAMEDALGAAHALRGGAGETAWTALVEALDRYLATLRHINEVRREMWVASRWPRYNDFRVFIMGITGNTALFGDGVVYEGVERFGGQPQQFRGQSGSQDDIIPTTDIFAGILDFYPDNDLTRYLLDMRAYRPRVVRDFLVGLEEHVRATGFWDLLRSRPETAVRLAAIVEQVYEFRNGHWQFVQKYIMATTKYAVATGGTPITSWIPNQIEATLKVLDGLLRALTGRQGELSEGAAAELQRIAAAQGPRVRILTAQVAELQKHDFDAALVYDLNAGYEEGPPVQVEDGVRL